MPRLMILTKGIRAIDALDTRSASIHEHPVRSWKFPAQLKFVYPVILLFRLGWPKLPGSNLAIPFACQPLLLPYARAGPTFYRERKGLVKSFSEKS